MCVCVFTEEYNNALGGVCVLGLESEMCRVILIMMGLVKEGNKAFKEVNPDDERKKQHDSQTVCC